MTSGSESAISPEGEGGGIKVDLGVPGGLERGLTSLTTLLIDWLKPLAMTGKDQN